MNPPHQLLGCGVLCCGIIKLIMEQVDKYTLYGTRLLVFCEENPQSNQYRQVFLTPAQFKKVSDAICTVISRQGDDENVTLELSENLYKLPDLQEIHKS